MDGDAARRQHSADWRIVRLAKIMLGTLLFEGVGAALLTLRFQEQMGWGKAIWDIPPFPRSATRI